MSYIIRQALEKDLHTVYRFICLLEETDFDYAAFEGIYKENLHSKNCLYLVAETLAEGAIAFISAHIQNLLHHGGKVAEIQELFVDETYRGGGIGNALVEALEKSLRAAGCISFEVTAQNKRTATHRFYEKLGFEPSHKKFVKQLH